MKKSRIYGFLPSLRHGVVLNYVQGKYDSALIYYIIGPIFNGQVRSLDPLTYGLSRNVGNKLPQLVA